MIEVIRQQFKEGMPLPLKWQIVREFLQVLALRFIYDKTDPDSMAFIGGTALRILFDLKRYSEDLDFSVVDGKRYDFDKLRDALSREFKLLGLPFEAKVRKNKAIHSLMMKFPGLPGELGLSPLSGQKISIKLEVDVNPPAGWQVVHTIVNKFSLFPITHYDLPSLYAGKLHACFFRKFTKGRDFYDFLWYLGKRTRPNWTLLNNAIRQTHADQAEIKEANFKAFLLEKLNKIDFDQVQKDVEPFLEDKSELNLFQAQWIRQTVESIY